MCYFLPTNQISFERRIERQKSVHKATTATTKFITIKYFTLAVVRLLIADFGSFVDADLLVVLIFSKMCVCEQHGASAHCHLANSRILQNFKQNILQNSGTFCRIKFKIFCGILWNSAEFCCWQNDPHPVHL